MTGARTKDTPQLRPEDKASSQSKKQIKDIIHIMSELIRAEEGPTWVRQSSVDHGRTEKDKTSIRTHIVQNLASGKEGSIDTIQCQTPA